MFTLYATEILCFNLNLSLCRTDDSISCEYILGSSRPADDIQQLDSEGNVLSESFFKLFISNQNYFRFCKLICCGSIYDLKRLIQC
jgi:hypothetical protein